MAAGASLFLPGPPQLRTGRLLAVGLALSLLFHVALFAGLDAAGEERRLEENEAIAMEVVEIEPPPPPEPEPEPEPIVEPEVAPRPQIVRKEPTPVEEPPPPPNAEPPPEEPPPEKPPPIRIGISLGSTTEGGSFSVGTGNTLYGKADRVASDPSEARPYAAPETTKAPFVPSSRVSSLPRVRKEPPRVYPEQAVRAGIEGQVVARIRIDENGKVVAVRILEGPGYGLEDAARSMLYRFLFDPAKVDGKAVATEINYTYTFLLN